MLRETRYKRSTSQIPSHQIRIRIAAPIIIIIFAKIYFRNCIRKCSWIYGSTVFQEFVYNHLWCEVDWVSRWAVAIVTATSINFLIRHFASKYLRELFTFNWNRTAMLTWSWSYRARGVIINAKGIFQPTPHMPPVLQIITSN